MRSLSFFLFFFNFFCRLHACMHALSNVSMSRASEPLAAAWVRGSDTASTTATSTPARIMFLSKRKRGGSSVLHVRERAAENVLLHVTTEQTQAAGGKHITAACCRARRVSCRAFRWIPRDASLQPRNRHLWDEPYCLDVEQENEPSAPSHVSGPKNLCNLNNQQIKNLQHLVSLLRLVAHMQHRVFQLIDLVLEMLQLPHHSLGARRRLSHMLQHLLM